VAAGAVACAAAAPAQAASPQPGAKRIKYRFGPISVAPGQNTILIGPNGEKPNQDGYITRIRPDLERSDGSVPRVDVLHLHHGVWLSSGGVDATGGGGYERFFASGEEKTIFTIPRGYGYPVRRRDQWLMNHMIHNLTTAQDVVYLTYEIDFVPADSPVGRATKPVRPIWLDVQNGSAYPVFDVYKGSGGDGRFTYPDEAVRPYGSWKKNEWKVDRDGTLLTTAGHVHPGGLYTDLDLVRRGGTEEAHRALHRRHAKTRRRLLRRVARSHRGRPRARARAKRRVRRRLARSHRRGHARLPRDDATRIFRSKAKYFDPNGPVSWDVSMTATDPDWRVGLKKGDRLRISATYDTTRASWQESMGIMLGYMSDDRKGVDPFRNRVDTDGDVTHGHLPENGNYGGRDVGRPDPTKFPAAQPIAGGVGIANFKYVPGDQGASGSLRYPPVVERGQQLRFENQEPGGQIFHTVTGCKPPCNKTTGISYPLADGPVYFDSAQLGYGPTGFTAASNRTSWKTPKNLKPGTYTYFCRVHPFMRGSFRVKK
jgi:plastocyanin